MNAIQDRKSNIIDYNNRIIKIIQGHESSEAKVMTLCDLIIPNVMDIPFHQISEIEKLLIDFQPYFSIAQKNHFLLGVLRAFLEYRASNFEKVIAYLLELNANVQTDLSPIHRAVSYVLLGACSRSLGEKEPALRYFQYAFEVYTTMPEQEYQKFLLCMCMYHVGEIYGELNDYEEMLNKHLLLLEFNKEWGNSEFENRALNGVGRAFQAQGLYATALKYLRLARANAEKTGNASFKARNFNDLGIVYALNNEHDQSLKFYEKALQLRQENKLYNAEVTTLIGISDVFVQQRQYSKAVHYLNKALHIAEPLKVNKKIYLIYQKLAAVYELQESFSIALLYYKKYHELKSQVENIDKTQVENQRTREINTELRYQKNLIEIQKKQIETSLNKLQENVKYLENFASVAAHDLKAPIRIATSFATLFERKYQGKLEEEDKEYIHFITHNIGRLSGMIDDLLLLSRLDQNLPETKVVDVNEIVHEVKVRLAQKIVDTNIQINIPQRLPTVLGHASLISQLFQNLIDNGIKYRKNDVPPILTITTKCEKESTFCEFQIQDNGKGIEKELQPHIFDLFSKTIRNDSSGIGLATCRKIVTHYGGSITVSSELEKGTCFSFSLPIVNN